jgi:outer membrane receptor protein involved in Fe transport
MAIGASAAEAVKTATGDVLEEVVVTGVLISTKLQDAPIAIATVSSEEIAKLVPISAADLLKNVPGVFVNSSLGEIRNIVFSRGVSANSLDGANGYFYVSLQEDGLPVTNVTYTNYGPDYFYRPDVTLGRLEALRGGTANLTGPNAPGGIFNYISRSGKTQPGVEVRARYGMEGDFHNPFYRVDAYSGGMIGNSGWSYSVGGFYRKAVGARDPGYDMNRGGQIKGNVQYDYANGSLMIYGKYLDDHNGWFEFLPAQNYNDPKLVSGIKSTFSFLPPSNPHESTLNGGSSYENWDGSDLVESKSRALGAKWHHDFGSGWTLDNNLKFLSNRTDWNTGAVIFPTTLSDPFVYILSGGLSPELFGSIPAMIGGTPATYTFKQHGSANVLARVNVTFNPNGFILPFNYTVTTNNLPNQQVLGNGVLTQAQLNQHNATVEAMDQFSMTKKLDTMSFTFGGFFARSSLNARGGGSGFGISPIANQPQLMDITLTLPNGTVQQVTNSAAVGALGGIGFALPSNAQQTQASLFFGHNWKFASDWTLDWGLRYEHMKVSGFNTQGTLAAAQPAAGPDGNPNSLYDNSYTVPGAPLTYAKTLSFTNYTAALSRKFSERQMAYVRISDGKKAPDVAFYQGLNTPFLVNSQNPVPEHIQQLEFGYRVSGDRYSLSVSPFYSKLSNVGNGAVFQDQNATFYARPTLFSVVQTTGVEVDATVAVTQRFDIHSVITAQNPKSKDFRVWIHDGATNNPANDTVVSTPDGVADNNPKIMANTTFNVRANDKFSGFLTWQYMGSRAANRANTFFLPAFSQFNLGMTWEQSKKLQFNLNVNNLLNSEGVMSWSPAGSFLGALDRQGFLPAARAANPNATFNVVTVQPRAGFLTVSFKLD